MSCGDRKWAPVVEIHHEASWLCDMSTRCLAMLALLPLLASTTENSCFSPVFLGVRAVIRVLCFRLNGSSNYYSRNYSMLPRTETRPVDSVGLFRQGIDEWTTCLRP